ncbi:MAG: hypothetical protein EBR88_00300 [Betaproteobacteria bacterium]|nr:hypothetical protein [Betaproteobacteria bacterium]
MASRRWTLRPCRRARPARAGRRSCCAAWRSSTAPPCGRQGGPAFLEPMLPNSSPRQGGRDWPATPAEARLLTRRSKSASRW